MVKQLMEVEVPAGYEAVRYGVPVAGELVLVAGGVSQISGVTGVEFPIVRPSPGAGWRLLGRGERLRDGDEFLFFDNGEWSRSVNASAGDGVQSPGLVYRRRIDLSVAVGGGVQEVSNPDEVRP